MFTVASGGHKGPLRKLFKKVDGKMQMIDLNDEPFPETDTFVEVKKDHLFYYMVDFLIIHVRTQV